MRISLSETIKQLRNGQVVAVPTETVYGLAALPSHGSAVQQIFALKGRPANNPLIIHIKDHKECQKYLLETPPHFELLTSHFWPGPLTLVLPIIEEKIPTVIRSGLKTAAFRMPRHPYCLELLDQLNAFVAPSANLSGKPSSTRVEHIENDFGSHFPVLDGGPSVCGVESTILSFHEEKWQLARHGAISQESIAAILGYTPQIQQKTSTPICPGQLFNHYAPKAKLFLSKAPYASCSLKSPYVLGYKDRDYSGAKKVISLGKSFAPEEVAFQLYDSLRILDLENIEEAWVDINIPNDGLWQTIFERLLRASQKA